MNPIDPNRSQRFWTFLVTAILPGVPNSLQKILILLHVYVETPVAPVLTLRRHST
jgi:hypothetical protein